MQWSSLSPVLFYLLAAFSHLSFPLCWNIFFTWLPGRSQFSFTSHFTSHYFSGNLDGFSSSQPKNNEVPQGSVLGFFSSLTALLLSDLIQACAFKYYACADDSQMYVFSPDPSSKTQTL